MHTISDFQPRLFEHVHLAVTLILKLDQVLQCNDHVEPVASSEALIHYRATICLPLMIFPSSHGTYMFAFRLTSKYRSEALSPADLSVAAIAAAQLHINASELHVARIIHPLNVRRWSEFGIHPPHPLILIRICTSTQDNRNALHHPVVQMCHLGTTVMTASSR